MEFLKVLPALFTFLSAPGVPDTFLSVNLPLRN